MSFGGFVPTTTGPLPSRLKQRFIFVSARHVRLYLQHVVLESVLASKRCCQCRVLIVY